MHKAVGTRVLVATTVLASGVALGACGGASDAARSSDASRVGFIEGRAIPCKWRDSETVSVSRGTTLVDELVATYPQHRFRVALRAGSYTLVYDHGDATAWITVHDHRVTPVSLITGCP